ncbi:secreted RxLR effector protein 161-like [Telopea speciosissima]|uniref:secreted RxLR effector protein 161-like n=1 Tax=Telopea speciosissima TaxID=54955 RepID=UPI001CC347D9|nr:secreted RxLR effector protein 161-like [Telopea speciosissima]
MENSTKGNVPFRHGVSLSKSQCPQSQKDTEEMKRIPYASVVGSLMYSMLCTRLDICYSIGIVSWYQSNPRREHWNVVKNILKYLRNTNDHFLVYGLEQLSVVGYTDSDFQTDKDDKKSTLGMIFMMGGGGVIWRSAKQKSTADSTIKAEYIAASDATKEAV